MSLYFEYQHLLLIFIGQWNDGDEEEEWIRRQALRVAGIDGPLRSGFDAGISWITVVQLDGGQPRSCRWGWSCNIRVSLETRDFCVRNKGLWRVKPRSSGGKRPDFRMRKKGFFSFLSCLFLCRFKRAQGNEFIYIYIINIFILRCRIETQWTKNLCNLLAMNGLYWDIDCTVCLPWWNRSGGNC